MVAITLRAAISTSDTSSLSPFAEGLRTVRRDRQMQHAHADRHVTSDLPAHDIDERDWLARPSETSAVTWASDYTKAGRPMFIDANRPGAPTTDKGSSVFSAPAFLGAKN
jgi:hypothetical protein